MGFCHLATCPVAPSMSVWYFPFPRRCFRWSLLTWIRLQRIRRRLPAPLSNPRLAGVRDRRSDQVKLIIGWSLSTQEISVPHMVLCSLLECNPRLVLNDINSANNSGSSVWGKQIRNWKLCTLPNVKACSTKRKIFVVCNLGLGPDKTDTLDEGLQRMMGVGEPQKVQWKEESLRVDA